MAITIKNPKEIVSLQIPNEIVAQSLLLGQKSAKEGMSLKELDSIIEDYILSRGATPSFKGLYGFPNAVCISVNEVIIHGIPSDYKLRSGDIVGIDVGVQYNGWYGDGAVTFGIGDISKQDESLISCAKDALYYAIDSIQSGLHFKELSKILEDFICGRGFVPLRGFCGHGIGRKPHEEPEIPNYLESPNPKQGPKIRNGMVFCIEPMIAQKDGIPKILGDNWSVIAQDGLNGSHYEHTVAVIDGRARILTQA